MIFVFGGAFAGKSGYVKNNLNIDKITPYDAECEELKNAAAIRDLHLYIKKEMQNGGDAYKAVDRLISGNPGVILISNEIGCGIVPLDRFERDWRETAGRVNCYLAEKAESVIRVVCGIGIKIK